MLLKAVKLNPEVSVFIPKSLAVLGRQPMLGLAELEACYQAEHVEPIEGAALLDIEPGEISFGHLGGTLKLARVLAVLTTADWRELEDYLLQNIPRHLKNVPEGTFTLGLSVYGAKVPPRSINQCLMNIKKRVRATGRSMRVVPNKEAALNSAQVLHNKLTAKGGWELILYKYKKQTILAQTWFVQDIAKYAARDQARPKRNARVGMLPPKLAQIIINLALGDTQTVSTESANNSSTSRYILLDPFCGSGVILQEALLMGYSVRGRDIDKRMVEYAKGNIKWLFREYPELQGNVYIEVADATNDPLPLFDTIASEVYLGKPMKSMPSQNRLSQIIADANNVVENFLINLSDASAWSGSRNRQRICLAVPAWQISSGKFRNLPVIDRLTEIGYTQLDLKHVKSSDLIYYRQDQMVARQLLILKKA